MPKTFPYFLIFPSTNSNLVTYLALYRDDQVTHNSLHHYPLSISLTLLFWNIIIFKLHVFKLPVFKISIYTSHISLNSMSHKVIIYKIHIQQSIYIYFLYILQKPYLTKHIYFLPSPFTLKHIKSSSKNILSKVFLTGGI